MGLVTGLALGAAAIGGGLSAISSNKNSKRAVQASNENNAANVALARDIYGQNKQILSPFVNRGNTAGNQINALLGLGGAPMEQNGMGQATMQPGAMGQPAGFAYGLGDTPGRMYQPNASGFGSSVLNNALATQQGGIMPANIPGASPTAGTTGQGQTPQQAANSAFDIFRNSTGYQFRLGEGLDAVSSAYAGIGGLQSGAAMRGINEYGQNFASNEFGNYMNALGGQQAVGAGAASSLAGVGQNFAGTVIDSNNANTQNQMAAQLGRQNVFGNMLGTIGGGALGFLGGRG